jgi:cell division protein FtsB
MLKVWGNNSKMKKKIIILILTLISASIAFSLFFASRLSELSDLDLFDIEDEDF